MANGSFSIPIVAVVPVELYDLSNDPAESHNLATDKPEIVKALSDKLKAWNATLPTEYIKADDRQDN